MYEAYYGLHERPFDLTPNPRFLYMTPGHREALSTIQYGIAGRKGITLVVGPAGIGKTTLVHAALERQQGTRGSRALLLTNPTLTRGEFFQFLALEFGLTEKAEASKTHFLRELKDTLIERHAAGVVTALIVDEAQAMPEELLEEVRLLANMETTTEKLLPVVLVGQLELAVRLNDPRLQQLKQRVAMRSTLARLSAQETAAYVAERLRIAGGDVTGIFTPEALGAIYECSGGIPRTISVLCDNALVSGFAIDQRPVGPAVIDEVRRDLDLTRDRHEDRRSAAQPVLQSAAQPDGQRPESPSEKTSVPEKVPEKVAEKVAAKVPGRGAEQSAEQSAERGTENSRSNSAQPAPGMSLIIMPPASPSPRHAPAGHGSVLFAGTSIFAGPDVPVELLHPGAADPAPDPDLRPARRGILAAIGRMVSR